MIGYDDTPALNPRSVMPFESELSVKSGFSEKLSNTLDLTRPATRRLDGLREEGFHILDGLSDAVGWEGVEEDAAVALALDARVEEHEDAAIVQRADEAAEALFEGDDGAGHLVVEEGVASGGGDGVHARLYDGVGGDGEGQAIDDDAAELLALYVYALPEAGRAEEDGAGGVAELFEQNVARGGSLEEQWVGEFGGKALVSGAHLRIAGEQAEGAAAGDLEDAAGALGRLDEEIGFAGVGHVGRQIEQRLLRVVEVRRDDEFAGEGEAETSGDVLEAGDTAAGCYGEGRRGEDDGAVCLEECGREELGDVDGRSLQVGVMAGEGAAVSLVRERADTGGGAALDPEDGVGVLRFEQELEVGRDVGGALAETGGFVDVSEALEFAFEARECVERASVGVAALF
jgi:hypothetical protein